MAAAIVLMLGAGAAAGADLGRLFFTPEQRATLDNARKQNIRSEIGSENEQQAAPVPQNISVNGVVRRSDGKSTVWINNRAVTDRLTGGISVSTGKNDGRVKLTMPESGRSVDLKVGQTVEIVSGTIEESYARRAPPNPDTKAVPGTENSTSGAEKGAPAQASRSSDSGAGLQRRAAPAGGRNEQDDAQPNDAADAN